MYLDGKPHCDMEKDCVKPVTHIGEKGYIYCADCAPRRIGWERCRKLRPWELKLLAEGKPIPSYEPISQAEALRRAAHKVQIRCAGCGLSRRDIEEPQTGDVCGCAFDLDEVQP